MAAGHFFSFSRRFPLSASLRILPTKPHLMSFLHLVHRCSLLPSPPHPIHVLHCDGVNVCPSLKLSIAVPRLPLSRLTNRVKLGGRSSQPSNYFAAMLSRLDTIR